MEGSCLCPFALCGAPQLVSLAGAVTLGALGRNQQLAKRFSPASRSWASRELVAFLAKQTLEHPDGSTLPAASACGLLAGQQERR